MNKMMNPEMEVVRFEAADVIATSDPALHALFDGTSIYTQYSTFDKGNVSDTDKQEWIKWDNFEGDWFTEEVGFEDIELTDSNLGYGLNNDIIAQITSNENVWFRQWGDGSWSVCKDSAGKGHYPGHYPTN